MAVTKETSTKSMAPAAEKTTSPTVAKAQVAEVKLVVTAEKGLNLRSGPHSQYSVLTVLEKGKQVTELELPMGAKVEGWHLVGSGKHVGWVNSQFVEKTEG